MQQYNHALIVILKFGVANYAKVAKSALNANLL